MSRPNWKRLLVGAIVVAALVTSASQANAFWGCFRGCYWGCYTPCYTPCYPPCYTPCYTACCYPSCGYGGCWSGCYWPSSCCDFCCDGAVVTEVPAATPSPTPAKAPATETPAGGAGGALPEPEGSLETPPPSPPETQPGTALPPVPPAESEPPVVPPAAPGSTAIPTRQNSGLLVVHVPYDAKVTINGLQTRSKGSRRQYVSYGLKPGFSYKYVIRAEVIRDGHLVPEEKTLFLTAGDRQAVAFGFNPTFTEGLVSR